MIVKIVAGSGEGKRTTYYKAEEKQLTRKIGTTGHNLTYNERSTAFEGMSMGEARKRARSYEKEVQGFAKFRDDPHLNNYGITIEQVAPEDIKHEAIKNQCKRLEGIE